MKTGVQKIYAKMLTLLFKYLDRNLNFAPLK